MNRKKHKSLLTLLICSALIGTGSFAAFADGITNQNEADALNTSLAGGSQEYTGYLNRIDRSNYSTSEYAGQVFSQNGTVTIGNESTRNSTLTLNAENFQNLSGQKGEGNIFSDASDKGAVVTNLESLNLKLSSSTLSSPRSNVLAMNGGTVTIDDSVQNLDIVNTRTRLNDMNGYNISARAGGIVKILSPRITLLTEGGYGSHNVSADSFHTTNETRVYLGDENHELESITIKHTTRSDDDQTSMGTHPPTTGSADFWGLSVTGDENTSMYVNTKKLDIRNMTAALHGIGGYNTGSRSLLQVNSADHRSQNIHLEATETGIGGFYDGDVKVYGDTISIQMSQTINPIANPTTEAITARDGGHVVIGTGSGAGQGLFLKNKGADSNWTYGFRAFGGDSRHTNTGIDVVSGNIDIQEVSSAALSQSGPIQLGTTNSPVNDIVIHNAYDGLQTLTNGIINVHGRTFAAAENVSRPIFVQSGTVDLHTSGAAVLQGTALESIYNSYGTINLNTDDSDGAAQLTGNVYTTGPNAMTNISFHTSDSRFYGSAFDDENNGKTTITVSNGADWTLDPTATHSNVDSSLNTRIDTLNLLNNGTVNLGGADRAARNYSHMQTANIAGNNGTLIFRTNLQESADNHTVNGHSDQLAITDSSAGMHNIMVNDYSQTLGQEAREGYVLLVRDQSAAPGAVFRGHADLQNGGLFAKAVEITNEAPDASAGYTDVPTDGTNWYLRMTDHNVPPVTPPKPTWNAKNNITFARSRYGALWIEQDTLRQRVGELRNHAQDDGVWARIDRGEYSMNGVNGNADYIRYHIGYDKQIGSQKGQKQYIGMAYHHTDTDLNYRHFTDDSDMDADIGTIYYTNLQDKGHYLDVVGKFGRMKGKMKTFGDFPESAKWDSPFYSLSAEYGRKVMYKNDWYIEPQAQLTYSHLGSDSYLTSQGTHAHVDGINSLIFRTGFTVGKKDGQNEYYGKVFWHHEFEGAEEARFHDKNDDSLRDSYDFGGSWVTVGFGGQIGIGKDAYLYGDIDKSFGGDVKKKWAWNIGVRFGF